MRRKIRLTHTEQQIVLMLHKHLRMHVDYVSIMLDLTPNAVRHHLTRITSIDHTITFIPEFGIARYTDPENPSKPPREYKPRKARS